MYKVEEPSTLLEVLKSRHPNSCLIYNQALKWNEFQNTINFYTIGNSITTDTWILSENIRRDYGHCFAISAPTEVVKGNAVIKPDIIQAFVNSKIINWDDNIVFIALEKVVSRMIFDISVNIKGNVTEAHPGNYYYMEIEDAEKINIKCPPNVQLRRLDTAKHEEKFIASKWNYSRPGSEEDIKLGIEANPSGGVFVDGKCVAGVFMSGYGLVSSLYTLHEFRGKGYGKLAMNFMYRECAKEGCVPGFTIEKRNTRSIKFNEGLGAKLVSEVEWLFIKKLEID